MTVKTLKRITFCLVMMASTSWAKEHQMIDVLGTSPKGQFVAVEEYGYKSQTHTYYVSVKFVNVWTKEYVGERFDVELPANRPTDLKKAREEARHLASPELKRLNISG